MLDENAILDAENVGRNPVGRLAKARKSPMKDHKISLCHNHSRFIPQSLWQAFDESEQAFASGRDVSAVLDIVGRPEALSRGVIAFVEQRFKASITSALFFSWIVWFIFMLHVLKTRLHNPVTDSPAHAAPRELLW
jgi:hypothetical protein